MGSPLTEDPDQRVFAALNNCGFVSTEVSRHSRSLMLAETTIQMMHNSNFKKSKPFTFLMDAAMLGYHYPISRCSLSDHAQSWRRLRCQGSHSHPREEARERGHCPRHKGPCSGL